MTPRALHLFCLAALLSCAWGSSLVTIQVEPKTEECFYIDARANEAINILFQVIRGGKLDIRLRVIDPSQNVIFEDLVFFNEEKEEFDGRNTFVAAQGGTYTICFDNRMSRYTAKVVSTRIWAGEEEYGNVLREEPPNLAKKGDLDPIEWALARINAGLITIEKEQETYRVREQAHRDLNESTNRRVFFFAMLECFLVLCLSLFQIFYLRRWFNRNKTQRTV